MKHLSEQSAEFPPKQSSERADERIVAQSSKRPVEQPAILPRDGVLLGIDYGTKRVGIAVSDMYQKYASPLFNHQRQGRQADERFFLKLIPEYRPVGLVVGLPIHLSGDESEKSREARRFAAWLSGLFSLPADFQDERFSSFQAEQLMLQAELNARQRKARIDKLAAQILLQTFLDRRQQESHAIPVEDESHGARPPL